MYHYTMTGLDNIYLSNGYTIEQTPYGEAVSIEGAAELDRAIALSLIRQPHPLGAKEFRFLRQQTGMSQSDTGAFIGADRQTVARWEKQETPLPQYADSLIRLLYSGYHAQDITTISLIQTLNALDKAKNSRIILNRQQGKWQETPETA